MFRERKFENWMDGGKVSLCFFLSLSLVETGSIRMRRQVSKAEFRLTAVRIIGAVQLCPSFSFLSLFFSALALSLCIRGSSYR